MMPTDVVSQGRAVRAKPAEAGVDAVARLRMRLQDAGVWHAHAYGDAHSPWYITLLQAGSAWLAALLLMPFLAWFLLGSLESSLTVPLGVAAFGGLAGLLGRKAHEQVFLGQMGAALGLAAGLMALGWAFDRPHGWLLPTALAIGLYLAGRGFSNRLLSGLTLAAALYLALARDDALETLLSGSLHTVAVLSWAGLGAWAVGGLRGARYGEAAVPLAWAFLVAAGFLAAMGGASGAWLGLTASAPGYWQPTRVAMALLPAAAWLLACWQAPEVKAQRRLMLAVSVVLLALVPALQSAPGLALALSGLIVGFAQSRVALMGVAGVALLSALGQYYYQLDVPLLHKAGWLGAAAAILALAAFIVGAVLRRQP